MTPAIASIVLLLAPEIAEGVRFVLREIVNGRAAKSALEQALADGKITEAEADRILAAALIAMNASQDAMEATD